MDDVYIPDVQAQPTGAPVPGTAQPSAPMTQLPVTGESRDFGNLLMVAGLVLILIGGAVLISLSIEIRRKLRDFDRRR